MRNKKGQLGIIIFFVALFVLLVIGLVMGLGIALLGWTSDQITPIAETLGTVDNINVSQAGQYTFGNIDSVINTFTWLGGVLFIVAIIACVMFVALMGENTHPAFMVLFFAFMILLIFFSILVSNAYQDLYEAGDVVGTGLQDQTLLSFMILYSPMLLIAIAVMTGIFIFVKNSGGGGELG